MGNKKELYTNIAGFVISAGLAMVTSGSSNMLLSTFSGLVGGKAGKFIDNIDFKKIKNLFKHKDPSDLESDLQNLIIEAAKIAIKNIQIHYSKKLSLSNQKTELINFNNSIILELNTISKKLVKSNLNLYKTIENQSQNHDFLRAVDIETNKFPIINNSYPYKDFFKEKFSENLFLCFGKLLKQEKNKRAYIDYQREIYKSIDNNLELLINQNKSILSLLEVKELKQNIRQTIASDEISYVFENSINNELQNIKNRIDLLVDITSDIKSDTTVIKELTKDFSKDLQENWISKNKMAVLSIISFSAIVIFFLVYKLNNNPFQMNLGVKVDSSIKTHSEYPKLSNQARLRIYFPNETKEKEISFSNEALFTELNPTLLSMKCKIQLIDKYWTTSEDSLAIKKGNALISIRPNKSLSEIRGAVSDIFGNPLRNTTISVEEMSVQTSNNGTFLITIPIELRKMNYNIYVNKNGYVSKNLEYISGSDISIRLKKY